MKYLARAIAVIAITGCFACSSEREPTPRTTTAEPTEVIDQELMIALSKAKNFHHKARVYMSDGKLAEATASVREILSLQFPAGAAEAEDVRNDARALLAKLLVGQGQLEEAMRVVQEGIAGSGRESFFVANLYTVKGEIHEARAAALDPADPAQKQTIVDEKHAAIESYDRAIACDPHYAEAHNNRGIALLQCGRYEAAIVSFDRAALWVACCRKMIKMSGRYLVRHCCNT